MASTRQHMHFKEKLDELIKEMPDFVVKYVNHRTLKYSSITLYYYVKDYKEFFSWLMEKGIVKCSSIKDFPIEELEKLSIDDVQRYFNELSQKKYKRTKKKNELPQTVDMKTVSRHQSSLRSLFKFLSEEAEIEVGKPYLTRNVMKKIPIITVKETYDARSTRISEQILEIDKIMDFLDYVENKYESTLSPSQLKYFIRDRERDFAILALFLGTGIRVNELVNLKLKDILFDKRKIKVHRKGNKDDSVIVAPFALEALKNYLAIRCDRYKASDDEFEYVFVKKVKGIARPLTVRAVEDIVKKYSKSYGKKMSPHKLRHTYATNMAEITGGDLAVIMSQLGHTNSEITLQYIQTSEEKKQRASDKYDRVLKSFKRKK